MAAMFAFLGVWFWLSARRTEHAHWPRLFDRKPKPTE
jgi:hypothetical protein